MGDGLHLFGIVDLSASDQAKVDVQKVGQMDRECIQIVSALCVERGIKQLKKRTKLGLFCCSFGGATEESFEESGAGTRSFLGHASILP
jgi:hypothetical protein